MVVMTVMVPAGCERRACNNQQEESGEKELLHAMQISMIWTWQYASNVVRIKSDTIQNGTEC